jgi:CrcB protein
VTTDPAAVAPVASPVRRRLFGRDPRELAAIFAGGVIGGGLRALLGTLFPTAIGHWPWVTFGVNIAGAILLGYFTTRLQERLPFTPYRRPLLGTGVCGGLTTFSTMQVEALEMIDAHDYLLAAGYLVSSVAAGLFALHLTTQLTRRVRVRRR